MGINGDRVRQARLNLALTQSEFADRLGVTERAVRQWESGKTGMRLTTVRKLALMTGRPPSYYAKPRDPDSEVQ